MKGKLSRTLDILFWYLTNFFTFCSRSSTINVNARKVLTRVVVDGHFVPNHPENDFLDKGHQPCQKTNITGRREQEGGTNIFNRSTNISSKLLAADMDFSKSSYFLEYAVPLPCFCQDTFCQKSWCLCGTICKDVGWGHVIVGEIVPLWYAS